MFEWLKCGLFFLGQILKWGKNSGKEKTQQGKIIEKKTQRHCFLLDVLSVSTGVPLFQHSLWELALRTVPFPGLWESTLLSLPLQRVPVYRRPCLCSHSLLGCSWDVGPPVRRTRWAQGKHVLSISKLRPGLLLCCLYFTRSKGGQLQFCLTAGNPLMSIPLSD